MSARRDARRGRPAPWLYLLGVLAWTWTFHGAAALVGRPLDEFPTPLLFLLGGAGPLAVPAILIATGRWDASLDPTVGAFFRRAFDPRTLGWRWYLVTVGLVAVLAGVPVLLDPAALRESGLIEAGSGLILLTALLGAFEEPGWRGYAQEGLQRRMPVVAAAVIVGAFWALWHLPLFFVEGTYQAGLGLGTPAFWAFHLALLVGSPVYAWLYNASGGVLFAAVLYHGLGNVARELVPDVSDVAEVGVEALLGVAVTLAAWRWMRRRRASRA